MFLCTWLLLLLLNFGVQVSLAHRRRPAPPEELLGRQAGGGGCQIVDTPPHKYGEIGSATLCLFCPARSFFSTPPSRAELSGQLSYGNRPPPAEFPLADEIPTPIADIIKINLRSLVLCETVIKAHCHLLLSTCSFLYVLPTPKVKVDDVDSLCRCSSHLHTHRRRRVE